MKKSSIISALLCVILMCFASCAVAGVDSKIVGKWNSESFANSTYTFKSNGTFERTTAFNEHFEGTYTAVDGVLTLDYGEEYQLKETNYKFNTDKLSSDYGDVKIGAEYFEKVK